MLNQDYKDMLECLRGERVEFLLVGAYALGAHGFPRATKDLDLWVRASKENAPRIIRALKSFGAPTSELHEKDFEEEGIIFQIGNSPRRIDILTQIDGVGFQEAWESRIELEIEGIIIPIISKEYLIRNKRAAGRPQDLVDVSLLEKARKDTPDD